MDMKKMQQESHLFGSNAVYIEELYGEYLKDEHSVDEHWREWFSSLAPSGINNGQDKDHDHLAIQASFSSTHLLAHATG